MHELVSCIKTVPARSVVMDNQMKKVSHPCNVVLFNQSFLPDVQTDETNKTTHVLEHCCFVWTFN